jgi:hypothetical protein
MLLLALCLALLLLTPAAMAKPDENRTNGKNPKAVTIDANVDVNADANADTEDENNGAAASIKEQVRAARDAMKQAREEARIANEDFSEARDAFKQALQELREAKAEDKNKLREKLKGASQDVLARHLNALEKQFQKLFEKGAISEEDYNALMAKIPELQAMLEDGNMTVEEVIAAAREIKKETSQMKHQARIKAGKGLLSRIEAFLAKADRAYTNTERLIAHIEARDGNQEDLRAALALFAVDVNTAKVFYEEARALYDEALTSDDPGTLINQGQTLVRLTSQRLKDSFHILKKTIQNYNMLRRGEPAEELDVNAMAEEQEELEEEEEEALADAGIELPEEEPEEGVEGAEGPEGDEGVEGEEADEADEAEEEEAEEVEEEEPEEEEEVEDEEEPEDEEEEEEDINDLNEEEQ